jgi:hypothetical protein
MSTKVLVCALLSACVAFAMAADGSWRTPNVLSGKGRAPLSGQVEALEWLAGDWIGEGLGGAAEFMMAKPSAGTMAGIFKHARDGGVTFYEFIVIGEFDGRTAVRFKHFHPDLRGWEAQDAWMEFPLLEVTPGRAAYFDGLTWRLNDDGSLEGFVIARTGDGPERELGFRYRAAPKAESAGAAKAGCRPLFSVHFGTLGMVLCRARSAADVEGLEGEKAEACKDFA